MKLPVLRDLRHMSPSSLNEWDRCQYRFYLKRLSQYDWPEYESSMAADVGSAFDAQIKCYLAEQLGLGDLPEYNLQALYDESVSKSNTPTAINLAKLIFKKYLSTGMAQRLIDEGLGSLDLNKKTVLRDDEHNEIPVYVKPDAALSDGTIVDWKVQGSVSAHGASPVPGYCYGIRNNRKMKAHDRAGEPMENLNKSWANQLAIYAWAYSGVVPWRPVPVAIENITCRKGIYTFTSIRTVVTVEHQQKLWKKLLVAYHNASQGEIMRPTPSHQVCFAYNTRCEVADRCEYFERWNDPKTEDDILYKILGR